jgi:hypothetical protein
MIPIPPAARLHVVLGDGGPGADGVAEASAP